jgi:aryl-alcohol dehydrogenase-like predicted oxidoreductase
VQQRTVGHSTLRVSEIGFGCGTGAGLMIRDEPEAQRAAIERALERGITYFDTAPIYGETRSERHLGRALRALDATHVQVGTKIALELDDLDDIAGAVVRSVEGSLERLGRASADIVYLHNRVAAARAAKSNIGVGALLTVDDVLGTGGVLEGLTALRKRGLANVFGCCSYGGETAALEALVDSDAFDAMLVHYNVINQSAFVPAPSNAQRAHDYGAIAARAAARGMSMTVLRVLEAGLLAKNGREQPSEISRANEARRRSLAFLLDGDANLVPAAIRFALSNPAVATVLVGISELAHVDAAADAAERGPLAPAQLERIEAARLVDFSS